MFKWIPFLLIFLLVLVDLQSQAADDCGFPMRLDTESRSMSHVPVLDQDSTELCYAYAASEVVDAYRFSHGDVNYHHTTSPIAAAISSVKDNSTGEFKTGKDLNETLFVRGGGSAVEVINSIRSIGSCNQGTVRGYIDPETADGVLDILSSQFDRFREYSGDAWFFQRWFKYSPQEKTLSCFLSQPNLSNNVRDINRVVSAALKSANPLIYLKQVLGAVCNGHTQAVDLPKPWAVNLDDCKKHDIDTTPCFHEIISSKLSEKNAQPVGIMFCSESLTSDTFLMASHPHSTCASHAALIIGRRKNSSAGCEYLIRNSWGTSCEAYKLKSESADQVIRECEIETGQIWVPAKSIERNINHIFGIGP